MGKQDLTVSDLPSAISPTQHWQPAQFTQHDNSLISHSLPLFGMIIHIRQLTDFECSAKFCQQVNHELQQLKQHWQAAGYNQATIDDALFFLCTLLDETLLKFNPNQLFLNHFFQQPWGGDKIYKLLDKALQQADKPYALLAFIQYCFACGLKGRYCSNVTNQQEFKQKLAALNQAINKPLAEHALWPTEKSKLYHKPYRRPRFYGSKAILLATVVMLCTVYLFYQHRLNTLQEDILQKIYHLMDSSPEPVDKR